MGLIFNLPTLLGALLPPSSGGVGGGLLTGWGSSAYAQMSITALPKTVAGGYNISCNGGDDGEVTTVVTGNTGPFTFLWSNTSTYSSINSLSAGTFWVTVTDSLNNTASDTVTLIQPSVLGVSIDAHTFAGGTHISEHGAADGEMYSDVTGGIPPYQYDWNTGSHAEWSYKDRSAGAYTLVVTDAGGCQADADQTLTEPDVFSASVQAVERANGFHLTGCGDSDGEAEITATGGVAPYTFYWLSGETDAHAYNLGDGEQEATVIDANGVERHVTFELLRPEKLAVEILTNDLYPNGYHTSCHNCSNATVTAQVTGGAGPYEYVWKGEQNATAQLQNAGDPLYYVVVTDLLGCSEKAFAKLSIPERDDWAATGNPGLDINGDLKWLGTTDSTDLLLKANNQPALRIGADGNVDVLGQLRLMNSVDTVPRMLFVDGQGAVQKFTDSIPVFDRLENIPVQTDTTGQLTQGLQPAQLRRGLLGSGGGGCTPEVWKQLPISTSGNTDMQPCPDGNVRIGSSVFSFNGTDYEAWAGARLHVHAQAAGYYTSKNLILSREGNTTQYRTWISKNSLGQNVLLFDASSSSQNFSSLVNALTIQQDGSIGMGTYTPKAKLQVNGSISVFSTSGNSSVFFGAEALSSNTYGKWGIQYADGGLNFWIPWVTGNSNSGNYKLFLKDDGNIGIGMNNPQYSLDVCGVVRAREMRVNLTGCDFVFEPGYPLMPLNELKRFIEKNRHLPDVAPARDMETEHGVAVGEMQSKLLQKIEELTLYVIQLENRLVLLEKE